MKKENKFDIFFRYFLILLSALGNLYIFYYIFSLPTVYLSHLFLNLIGDSIFISPNIILFNETLIEIVSACVAGSAYFLLFFLAMSIPTYNFLSKVKLIAFLFGSFFILNVLRIVVLASISKTNLFEIAHLTSWYLVSTLLVVLIWFSAVKIFKIKEIPFYSDFKSIKNN